MASMNKVFLVGNLTRDPELRYTPSGTAVADIGLAVNRRFRSAAGEDREDTCFVDIVVWDKQAKNCSEYLSKGSPLLVEGRLQMDQWEKDGKKYTKLRVVAERTQFLGSGSRRSGDNVRGVDSTPSPHSAVSADDPGTPEDGKAVDNAVDEDNLPF